MKVSVSIPGLVPSAANLREHWRRRADRVKKQRWTAYSALLFLADWRESGAVSVRFVRVAARKLDDDNLAFAFKAMRDGVADVFKRADNDPWFGWDYEQEPLMAGEKPHARIDLWFHCLRPQKAKR